MSTAPFGFKDVPIDEKKYLVRDVFASVASRYDLMNDLMSGGMHRLWKKAMIRALNPTPNMQLLDVAGGTGDISFAFLRALGNTREAATAWICDINQEMIKVGRDRAIDRMILDGVEWICGNAEQLPVPDQSIDAYTIAFGLRNVTNIELALAEAYRVLKPGGKFLCLEFSHMKVPGLKDVYKGYLLKGLPKIGQLVARDEASYRYLAESILRFPKQEELLTLMQKAGFERSSYRNYSGGITALHIGYKA